ncbi:MAG TPA: protein kinase [Kofleriaceae bacterium]|nr:protein kinase [Kofleriaceae bacterium]
MLRGLAVVVSLAAEAVAGAEPARSGQFTGEPFASEPFAFEVFTRQQGAPENSFYSLATDRHGRLALGMINGAGLFNGTSFRRLDGGDGTPHGATVYSIATDPSDRVWVGTPKGLFVDGPAGWHAVTQRDGLPNPGVNHVRYVRGAGGERDAVYVATQGGVAILDADSLQRRGTIDVRDGLPGDNVYVTLEIAAGPLAGLWVGGPWGLAHRAPGKAFAVVMAGPTPPEQATRGLYFDDERAALWVGTEAGLVRIGADRRPVAVPEVRDAPIGSIARVRRRDGAWLCAARLLKGVSCLDAAGGWREFHLAAEPGTERAAFALATAGVANGADVLWIATDAGLVRAVEPAVKRIAGGPPILQRRIDAVLAASDGALWIASGAELARIAWPRWSLWQSPDGDEIRALREVSHGAGGRRAVTVGTGLGKIFVFDGDAAALASFEQARGSAIQDIAVAREAGGPVQWVGVNGALWARDGERGRAVNATDGLRSLWISKLLATPRDGERDDLWIGLNSTGLARRKAGAWENLPAQSGVDESDTVTALVADRGALWVGMQAAGARRLSPLPDPTRVDRFTESSTPALPDGTINSIGADRDGRIYLCTNRGIGRLEEQPGPRFAIRTFNRDDGMPDEECSMSTAATDARGRVFLGTMHGLAYIEPSAVDDRPRPAELLLERASYAGDAALADGARLDHDENKLVFEYALVVPDHAREVSYRTQLIGAEPDPEVWQQRTRREFTGLSPGDYEFVVVARDHLGREHGPVGRRFRIAPPIWATPWAFAGYLAIAGLAVFGAVRTRIRVLRARAEHLEREVDKRTEEVRKQAAELLEKNEALEQSYKQADRIFAALKQAMPGTVLDDRYLLHESVGEGGFGVVYRCSEVRTGEVFAAKMFKPKPGNDSPEAIERFKREAVTVSRVKHDNAVRVLDGGVSPDGIPYIIMELLKGRVLDDVLDGKTTLSVARTAAILTPVCDVLAAAHAEGLVHRDIKPENIFLHQDAAGGEVIKVLDFGVAKLLDDTKASLRSLTASGHLVGTPQYMAPERLSESAYDGRSDIYAVGIILFQCLIGRLPFPSDGNLFAMIVTQMKTPPPKLIDLDPTIPEAVQTTVLAALEKDPERRPSAAELAAQLRQWPKQPADRSVSSDRSVPSDRSA